MTMPETTPMPNETAKIFSQKKYRSRHSASRVRSQRHSRKASQLARPIVKAGNRMWKEMTKPNWIRDSNSGDSSGIHATLSAARGGAPRRIVCAAITAAGKIAGAQAMTDWPVRRARRAAKLRGLCRRDSLPMRLPDCSLPFAARAVRLRRRRRSPRRR